MQVSLLYPLLKMLHVGFALISITALALRFWWNWRKPEVIPGLWLKIGPHINNALLIISAFALAFLLALSPHSQPWLMNKLIFLVLYVVLAILAVKPTFSLKVRAGAFISAFVIFMAMAHIAVSKMDILTLLS